MADASPAWKYWWQKEGEKSYILCKFCDHVMQHKEASSFIFHLSYYFGELGKEVKKCPNVPLEVEKELLDFMLRGKSEKARKEFMIKNVPAELRGNLESSSQHFVDDNDDEEDIDMCSDDMDLEEEEACGDRPVPKEFGCQKQQKAKFFGEKDKKDKEPQSQHLQAPLTPSLNKSEARQKMDEMIGKFFIHENIPPEKVSSEHFKNMIIAIQQAGSSGVEIPLPTPYEIENKYLCLENKVMQAYVDSMKSSRNLCGCTVMCDGRMGPSILNFMVHSQGKTVFLKSIDASNKINDHLYIYELLEDVVNEVGKDDVVQVVTSYSSAFEMAGKRLMEKFDLYWTPCATHCLDLMLEDIGKKKRVRNVINKARKVIGFIYKLDCLDSQLREVYKEGLVQLDSTRFGTNYIALATLLKTKMSLKRLFTSKEWAENSLNRSKIGMKMEERILDHKFWDNVAHIACVIKPFFMVRSLVDMDVLRTMPILYGLMSMMKKTIQRQKRTKWVLKIISERWDNILCHPLHAAAYFLTPKYHYKESLWNNIELVKAAQHVFSRLNFKGHPNRQEQESSEDLQLMEFSKATGSFGRPEALAARSTVYPVDWWLDHGRGVIPLCRLAIRIFSQTTSSSVSNLYWSPHASLKSRQQNQLARLKLQRLEFCYYNMNLKMRDEKVQKDEMAKMDFLDLFEMSMEPSREDKDLLFEWIRSTLLDDKLENLDQFMAAYACEDETIAEKKMEEVGQSLAKRFVMI